MQPSYKFARLDPSASPREKMRGYKYFVNFLVKNKAEPTDYYLDELKWISHECEKFDKLPPSYDVKTITDQMFRKNSWFCCVKDFGTPNQEMVGVACITSADKGLPTMWVFFVRPADRCQHVYRKLIRGAIRTARRIGTQFLTVDQVVDIQDLQMLVQHGFQITGKTFPMVQLPFCDPPIQVPFQTPQQVQADAILRRTYESITKEDFEKSFPSAIDSTGVAPVVWMVRDVTQENK